MLGADACILFGISLRQEAEKFVLFDCGMNHSEWVVHCKVVADETSTDEWRWYLDW